MIQRGYYVTFNIIKKASNFICSRNYSTNKQPPIHQNITKPLSKLIFNNQFNRNNQKMQIQAANQAQILHFFKQQYGNKNKKIYAYYSSDFGKIITDQYLMLMPVDERMAVRAHGVFDVIYMKKCRLINLDSHITRLLKSAETVSINLNITKDQIKTIIINVSKFVLKKMKSQSLSSQQIQNLDFGVRVSISSGYGDFGIASLGKKPVLYVYIFQPYINYMIEKEGVNDFVVKVVPSINKQLVHTKTVNYIDNAIMANESKKRGGYMGIKALENGILLQAAVANIGFIFGKQFATPRFQTVIEGTTIKKLLLYLNQLKEQGHLQKISFRDITIHQVQNNASEMMIIGGDKIVPVLNFNGKKISQEKGNITKKCQIWYQQQILKQDNIVIDY